MPIFEYQCRDCQTTFEVLAIAKQDSENITCPSCKSSNVHKLMSSGAAISTRGSSIPSPFGGGCASRGGFS